MLGRYDAATRIIRSELSGTDRHGNRYYALDVLPGLVVEQFEPFCFQRVHKGFVAPSAETVPAVENESNTPGVGPVADFCSGPRQNEKEDGEDGDSELVLESSLGDGNHVKCGWGTYSDADGLQQLMDVLHANVSNWFLSNAKGVTRIRSFIISLFAAAHYPEATFFSSFTADNLGTTRILNLTCSLLIQSNGEYRSSLLAFAIRELLSLEAKLHSRHFFAVARDREEWIRQVRSAADAVTLR